MRKTYSKFFASMLICMTLSVGTMAGDISCGIVAETPTKCGDISCGKVIPTKDTILAQVLRSLAGIVLGE